jgi:hypothetical protein
MNHAVGTSSSEKAFWRHFEKCHHFDFMMTVHDDATHDDGGMVVMARARAYSSVVLLLQLITIT